MSIWFLLLSALYLICLITAAIIAQRQNDSFDDYMMAGRDLGFLLGSLTVAASLFSAFALLGMPDFFRQHGVGAWIFLAVSDAALVFCIIWFGPYLRSFAADINFKGLAGLLSFAYDTRWAGYLYLLGIFIFLIPYVAVQIRGISIFMDAIYPDMLSVWGWATVIISIILIYSELGGLKAIIFADAIQGLILLTATLIISSRCVIYFGDIGNMFEAVKASNEALLSTPGPQGLFTTQFLVMSFISIVMISITQPQMTVRFIIMRDIKSLHKMAITLGMFAMIVILAIIPIGMYGAVVYSDLSTSDYLAHVLVKDQLPVIGAFITIGVIAAAVSTADSLLFAMANEVRSLLSGSEKRNIFYTRAAIVCFSACSLVVAILSNDQLVLLARVSFTGTAIMAPFIISAILCSRRPDIKIITATGIGLLIFLLRVFGIVPDTVYSIQLDLLIFVLLCIFSLFSVRFGVYRT